MQEVLIGALDQQMMDACEKHGVPCILIDGGEITKQLSDRKSGNVRNDPAIYPKMSVLKVCMRMCRCRCACVCVCVCAYVCAYVCV